MRLPLLILASWSAVTYAQSSRCRNTIDGGPRENFPCKFPFFFNGKTHNGCTTDKDPDNRLWCSTKTFPNGTHVGGGLGNWGYCNEGCDSPFSGSSFGSSGGSFGSSGGSFGSNGNNFGSSGSNRFTTARPIRRTTKATTTTTRRPFTTSSTRRPSRRRPAGSSSSSGRWQPDVRNGECGLKPSNNFIVGGQAAKSPGDVPFMALLGYDQGNGRIAYLCGGTLINRRYVVTAAHCHSSSRPIAEVVLGELIVGQEQDCFRCQPVQRFRIRPSDVKVHEGFRLAQVTDQGNDIALVRLPSLVRTNREDDESNIVPICLPWTRDIRETSTSKNFIAGWGRITSNPRDRGDLSSFSVLERFLMVAEVPVLSHSQCSNFPGFANVHPNRHICAGGEDGQ